MQDNVEAAVAGRGLATPYRAAILGIRILGEVLDQASLDGEHGIRVDVFAAADEDVGGQFPVTGGGDEEVDVGGAVGVPVSGVQQVRRRVRRLGSGSSWG